jgi:glycosyltransferase involved in cell wall biosynthesis
MTNRTEDPLVSIIVRTKDRPELLKKALKSIEAQTYRPIEVILVNDGGCELDIQGLESILGDVLLNYIRLEKNTGRAHAGNTGIEHAHGVYIGFLDDDDELYPEHLSELTEIISRHDYRVVYSDANIVYWGCTLENAEGGKNGKRLFSSRDFSYSDLLLDNYIPLMCLLFSRGVFKDGKGFDENFDIYEDWDMLIRIAEKYPFRHVKKTTADYIQWSGTQQVAHSPEFAVNAGIAHRQIINKHKNKFTADVIMDFIQIARKVKLVCESGAEAYITSLEDMIRQRDTEISRKDTKISRLMNTLTQITQSRGWRIIASYYKMRDKVLPPDSKRRLFYDLILIAGEHPRQFLTGISKHNIKRFFQQYDILEPDIIKRKVVRKTSLNQPSGTLREDTIRDMVSHEQKIFYPPKYTAPPREENRVLVIDRFIPTYDKDSGSLRMFAFLQILSKLGYIVTFLPDDLRKSDPYAGELQAIGIEVLSGNLDVQKYLEETGSVFSFVILSRPEQTFKYLPLIRAYAINSVIAYDTVDLHWLRFERAAAVSGEKELLEKAMYYKSLENFNASCSDVVFTVTQDEKEFLLAEHPERHVEVIPNIHDVFQKVKSFNERKDIMFIGSFLHQPNEDAVLFFVRSIFPLIRKKIPDTRFFVVGSDPLDSILTLDSETIKVTGYVKDVTPYFENCRVFVAPLRYGAGMKGKIGQSMAYGLPVVTTTIGAEGIGLKNEINALISDEPEEFADSVIRLYSNEELWNGISLNAIEHIESNYSKDVVSRKIAELFASLKSARNIKAETLPVCK